MNINVKELLEMDNINIIDIRDNYKYEIDHIDKAINIPYKLLLANPNNYLNKNTKYYLYCDNGNKSEIISNELNYLGYNTINIIGGFNYYLLIK